jgi:hypothetical protein
VAFRNFDEMTETKGFVEEYITENTLDEILSAMRDPLPIAPDKQPEIIEHIREILLAVRRARLAR